MLFDPYTYDWRSTAGQALPAEEALAGDPLLEVPADPRPLLWRGLTEAVEGALDLWDRLPPGRRSAPLSTVQHAGKRRFPPAVLRAQNLPGWHRLVRIELGLAVEALEALVQTGECDHCDQLAEQCARVGQLYAELERRAGAWVAQALLAWELRLLRYRASPVLAVLLAA